MPVFDTTALLHFFEADANVAQDPSTNLPVTEAKARIDLLISTLEENGETIVVPTPVLSEVLVHAGSAGSDYLRILENRRCFRIAPFDIHAAIELAAMTHDAIATGDLRAGTSATRAKLKFDRQIIAIALVEAQTTIYSDDKDVAKLGRERALEVFPIYSLPLPPEIAQRSLDLGPHDKT